VPPVPSDSISFPIPIPADQIGDFSWVVSHMSVDRW